MLQKNINDPLLHKLISMMGGCDMEIGPWIAGGAARRLWFGEPWQEADVDFWFADPMQFERAKDILGFHVRASALHKQMDNPYGLTQKYSGEKVPIHESSRAITYQVLLDNVTSGKIATAQIIRTRWMKDVDDIFGYFDFTACNFVTDGMVVMTQPDSVKHVHQRRLVINRQHSSDAPRVCPRRVIKYSLYGFLAENEIMRHLIGQIDNGRLTVDESQDNDDGY